MAVYCALAGLLIGVGPAQAQFGQIFGGAPPRPPANVPGRAPAPAPLGMPEQMPPEEMDEDVTPPAPAARAVPPQAVPRPGQPGAVRSQPLAPPAGATAAPPSASPGVDARLQPGQAAAPTQPAAPPIGVRPQVAPGSPQQPVNTAPQPGDEVVTEMPSQKIANPTAVFAGLDKITGRIISFEVALNEKVQFGALQVTPRVCYTRPPTETANTDAFVEVNEVTLQGEVKRIFGGWMFANSPGLHAVEHPIYDVWLTNCKGGTTIITDAQPSTGAPQQRQQTPGQSSPPRSGVAASDTSGRAPAPGRPSGQQPLPASQPPAAQQQPIPAVPPPSFNTPRR